MRRIVQSPPSPAHRTASGIMVPESQQHKQVIYAIESLQAPLAGFHAARAPLLQELHEHPGHGNYCGVRRHQCLGDGSLPATAPSGPMNVGGRPTKVAPDDFNGAGKQNLAVANAEDNTLPFRRATARGGAPVPGIPLAVG